MAWFLLVIAGLFETAWAVGLKHTEGFTRLWPTVFTGATLAVSMGLLGVAVRTLPIGTAYAVWVGIGAAGTAIYGMVRLGEATTAPRLLFLGLLLVAVVGLKATSGSTR